MDTQVDTASDSVQFDAATDMLKLLADETRLRIIWELLSSERSVNELAELVGAQPAGVSQHLAKLRLSRLVRTRRDGNRIYYVVDDVHVRRLIVDVVSHANHVNRSESGRSGSASRSSRVSRVQ